MIYISACKNSTAAFPAITTANHQTQRSIQALPDTMNYQPSENALSQEQHRMPEVPETDFEKAWLELEEDIQQEEDAEMEDELEKDAEAAWRELEEEAERGDVDMEDELEKDAEASWRELEAENQMDEDVVDMEDELERDFEAAWRELEKEAEQELQEETNRRRTQPQALFEEGLEQAMDGFLDEAPDRMCKAGRVDDAELEGCTTTAELLLPYQCTLCGPTITPTLRLEACPKGIGFKRPAGRRASTDTHYCLDCSEQVAREFATDIMMRKSIPLRRDQVRTKAITHLLNKVLRQNEMVLIADYFGICRCCHNPTALVETPGDPCNSCRHVQRCDTCGRFGHLLIQCGDSTVCRVCQRRLKKPSQGIIRADRKTGNTMPKSKCYECGSATGLAMFYKYCRTCRSSLKELPGEKCAHCGLQPKPEKSDTCQFCKETHSHPKQRVPGTVHVPFRRRILTH
jgi:hypothetical protein